jgi:predicted enzyme related to lactoylglutathione lyase
VTSVKPFGWYELRTTDTIAAQAFYEDVLGLAFRGVGGRGVFLVDGTPALGLAPLPERAAARGAPAHWLGHVAAGDVDEHLRLFVASGAETLAPVSRDADGAAFATVRDPLGAVIAISARTAAAASGVVVWHQHHTTDLERAFAAYAGAFGWSPEETWDLGDAGPHRTFAWERGRQSVGTFADTARLPNVHTHWLFHFGVPDVDATLAKARGLGAVVVASFALPTGGRVAVCVDPQGAAFALHAVNHVRSGA